MAYQVFTNGSVLNASEVNDLLMNQSVISFSNVTERLAAIPTPIEGMVTYLTQPNSTEIYNGQNWVGLVPQSQNFIINGAMDIWQRGSSFTPVGGTYTADRWRAASSTATPTLRTVTRQSFSPNELQVNNFGEPNFYLRSTLTTIGPSSTGISIGQRIEDVRSLVGLTFPSPQSATMSFWAKSDVSRTQTVDMRQSFGSGGSSAVIFASNTFQTDDRWRRFSFTFEIPSLMGKTIGANSFLELVFSQAFVEGSVLDLWGVQLEAGAAATYFKRNASSLGLELEACQRYYQRINYDSLSSFSVFGFGSAASTTTATLFQRINNMRIVPNAIDFSAGLLLDDLVTQTATTSISIDTGRTTSSVLALTATAASGLTQFRPYSLRANSSSTAFVGLNAEL